MDGYCVECGNPHPSVFVYTDDKGEERFVHDRCLRVYTQRVLGVNYAQRHVLPAASSNTNSESGVT